MKRDTGAWRRLPLLLPLLLLRSALAGRSRPAAAPRQAALRGRSAADFVHGLEASVRKVLGHIQSDRSLVGKEAKDRDHVAELMEGALASEGGVFLHAMALHKALWAAQGFLLRRTKELSREHTRLASSIEEQQARVLYAMLRQRRRLPVQSQVVLLKRRQFANCSYARRLLERHAASPALYRQLAALLPAPLARELAVRDGPRPHERLAAGGSEGRVHVVSSRLKNDVKKMETELRQAHDQISHLLAQGSVQGENEKRQAKGVMADLENVLRKANSTNDLKVQLDTMFEVQGKMAKWMRSLAA